MPKGQPGSGETSVPRGFRVYWDAKKKQWGVRQGERWRFTRRLTVQVSTWDEQGDGQLQGVGVVRTLTRGDIVVTA